MTHTLPVPAGVDELRVTGTLDEDARVTYTGEPHQAVLMLHVRPAIGMAYLVRQAMGTDPTVWRATEAKAAHLKRGAQVRVFAKGLRVHAHTNGSALLLVDVTGVFPIQLPDHQPSGKDTEAATTTEEHDAC
ncbi:MAG: hypothetical protein EOP38_20455 [Rubrivivax sp.]|nr:MAG: hypothetical protein EOP38_20455 [Rubrivivax sp.]